MKPLLTILLVFVAKLCCPQIKPISLHPDNPHYFLYHNKPRVLITSGEHYGAVLNLDFDFIRYLNTLQADSLNLTRTFTGAYVEPPQAFNISGNTLSPVTNRMVCPWARSKTSGYSNGGNKFDLAKWDDQYFTRLKEFVREAEKRGVIVELALFCPFYENNQWSRSPMNGVNNVNDIRIGSKDDVYTLDKNGKLLAFQEKMVKKIVTELKSFSNVIYEICNEPYFGGVTMEWQHHIASIISETEKDFVNKHLISQNIANLSKEIKDPHPAVSVFNFHYAFPPIAVAKNWQLNKVIGDNETGFRGNTDSAYRREGWQFVLAGGGLYNNLDYSFSPGKEDGTFQYSAEQPGGGSKDLRKQLNVLQQFISSFDFIHMQPDSTLVTSTGKFKPYVLAEKGKQYAIYIFGSRQKELQLKLPNGAYRIEWLDPVTGTRQPAKTMRADRALTLKIPDFAEDAAVSVTRVVQ